MKAVYTKVIYLILGLALLTSCAMEPPMIFESSAEESSSMSEESIPDSESSLSTEETMGTYVKAVWLSQYDMVSVYTANGKQRSSEEYLPLLKRVLENVAKDGYNTVIVQMRPFGDSMYPSELYPPSRYASGSYDKELTYDPIKLLIMEAKAT